MTPCFDAVLKSAAVMGLNVRGCALRATNGFALDFAALEAAITPKTRALFLNSPSSPLGKVFTRAELEAVAAVVRQHPDLLVVSDEVYSLSLYLTVFALNCLPSTVCPQLTLFALN
jgi:aspartate/methionine/tyrosine aminotransferase